MTKGAIIEIEPFSYSMGISANLQFYHYDIKYISQHTADKQRAEYSQHRFKCGGYNVKIFDSKHRCGCKEQKGYEPLYSVFVPTVHFIYPFFFYSRGAIRRRNASNIVPR